MNLGPIAIHRERPGVISRGPCWVAIDRREPYMYIALTLRDLARQLTREWRHERHLIA